MDIFYLTPLIFLPKLIKTIKFIIMNEKMKTVLENGKKVLKSVTIYTIVGLSCLASFFIGYYYNKVSTKSLETKTEVTKVKKNEVNLAVDQNNNLINFNNIDWSRTILIETSYEVENLSQTQMIDILKQQNKLLEDLANTQEPPPAQEQPINPVSPDDLDFFLYSNPNLTIRIIFFLY